MTANEVNRGGRPPIYDWTPLAERIQSIEDLAVIEAALREYSSKPTWAAGAAQALGKVKLGDVTGGVSRKMGYHYRAMLAELPFDPLRPPGGRRRILRELSQRGGAELAVLAGIATAGAVALAIFSPSEALRIAGLVGTPIMPDPVNYDAGADSRGPGLTLVQVAPDGVRECGPDASSCARPRRARYTRPEAVAA